MKLGYCYTVTAGGAGSKIVNVGSEELQSIVDDERSLWQKYAVDKNCLSITFTKDAMILVVTKVFGGSRPDNNVSTWIHIPSKVKVSGVQLMEIVAEIRKLYEGGTKGVTEKSFTENPVLNQDFEERTYAFPVGPSDDKGYAYRSGDGGVSLVDVLDKPFQDYYRNYRYILLFNENPPVKEGLEELSARELEDILTVLPPSSESISELFGAGNVAVELDGCRFNGLIRRKRGSMLMLTARRSGFLPIHFTAQAVEDEKEAEYVRDADEWRRCGITNILNQLQVKDADTGKRIYPNVLILDKEWDRRTDSLPENRLHEVLLKFSVKGYVDKETVVDLSQPVVMPVSLQRIVEEPVNMPQVGGMSHGNGTDASETRHSRISKTSLLWIAAAVLGVFVGAWVYLTYIVPDPSSNHSEVPPVPSADVVHPNDSTATQETVSIRRMNLARAENYIRSCNGRLLKDSLDANPETEGLFEALDGFELNDITGKWKDKFEGIQEFQPIAAAAQACMDKKYNPKVGKENGRFNKEGDAVILIRNWVNWVDGECAKTAKGNESQTKPKSKTADHKSDEVNEEKSSAASGRGSIE